MNETAHGCLLIKMFYSLVNVPPSPTESTPPKSFFFPPFNPNSNNKTRPTLVITTRPPHASHLSDSACSVLLIAISQAVLTPKKLNLNQALPMFRFGAVGGTHTRRSLTTTCPPVNTCTCRAWRTQHVCGVESILYQYRRGP